jgi:hypothetical protein
MLRYTPIVWNRYGMDSIEGKGVYSRQVLHYSSSLAQKVF